MQACRFGLNGTLVHPRTYEQISLREDIMTTLRHLRSHSDALASTTALEHIAQIAHEGSDANYLRHQYQERGSVEGMVDAALQRFQRSEFDGIRA